VVFVLDPSKCPVPTDPIVDIHLLDKLKPLASTRPLPKVEEFKLQEGIRPMGLLATVTKSGLAVFDFDQAQDKKAATAHVVGYVETEQVLSSILSEDQMHIYL
jgi:hypothetical protein